MKMGSAVSAYEIQILNDEKWEVAYRGTTIGAKTEIELPGKTVQKFKLVIKEFSAVPGIYEIVLL